MAQTFNTSIKQVASAYTNLLNAKVTSSSIQKSIEENPYYPSLFSLSETFTKYNIKNKALAISHEDLVQLNPPFVAYIAIPNVGNDFVLVSDITNKVVSYQHKNNSEIRVTPEDFFSRFQNVVFLAEVTEKSGERDFRKKRNREKKDLYQRSVWILGLLVLLFFAFIISLDHRNWLSYSVILLIKIAGNVLTLLLLGREIGVNNSFVQSICTFGKKKNCEAVLNSKGAKILGVSWGEIGFFYFSATTLWLFFPSIDFAYKITFLAVINAFAVPFILFSIYYQWKLLGQWCVVCLAVQAVLFSEFVCFVIVFWNSSQTYQFNTFCLLCLVICILVPILGWYNIKGVLIKSEGYDLYRAAYKRLHFNRHVFESILGQQQNAGEIWPELGIGIGNPDAATTIITVCNPYCEPCAKAHIQLDELLQYVDDLRIKIIFTTKNNGKDISVKIVRHLLSIAAKGNESETQKALSEWFLNGKDNYDLFALKYPLGEMANDFKEEDSQITAMSTWCDETEITYTPTVFMNGSRVPDDYTIDDLRIILENLSGVPKYQY